MLKQSFAQFLPRRLRSAIGRRLRVGSSAYDSALSVAPTGGVSDYLLFRRGGFQTRFVAENVVAILQARPLPCRHMLFFLNADGKLLLRHEISTDRFNLPIDLNDIGPPIDFGGFIHQVFYEPETAEAVDQHLIHQHRGYTGYRYAAQPQLPYSHVHGNFGGLFVDAAGKLRTFAVQRQRHVYSSQLIYTTGRDYELFFLNPTASRLKIALFKSFSVGESRLFAERVLSPFGAARVAFPGEDLQISWVSRLPVGRPIIFEHGAGEPGAFDVCHG